MKAHWIKFAPSDFLNGCLDLNAEQTGAYITVLCLIWDNGGPIPDDESRIARRIGAGRLKWRHLRQQLLELGKITLEGGMITNRRAMQEVRRVQELSGKRAAAAGERWGKEPDLFEGGSGENSAENGHSRDANASCGNSAPESGKPPAKPPEKITIYPGKKPGGLSQKNKHNALKTNEPGDANAFSLAGAREELELDTDNNNDQLAAPPHARAREGTASDDRPPDLFGLTMACCEAAGMAARIASRPALLTQSLEVVKGWRSAGVDILATAVPTITAQLDRMNEPAHSLAKFSAAIDTHHAKAKRYVERNGTPLPPPPTPVFEFSDEAEDIRQFRTKLAESIGRANYSQFCKAVAFRVIDWREAGDGQALQIGPREGAVSRVWEPGFVLERYGQPIRSLAKTMLGSQIVLQQRLDRNSAKPSGNPP